MATSEQDRVYVVHPNSQHSGELAVALDQHRLLQALVTRLQFGEGPKWPWGTSLAKSRLPRRQVPGLRDEKIVRIRTVDALAQRLINPRLSIERAERSHDLGVEKFQRAAMRVCRDADLVIGFSRFSGTLFSELERREPAVRRVLDLSHPPDSVVQTLLREDAKLHDLDPRNYDDYRSGGAVQQDEEFALAHRIMVASQFSARTLVGLGVESSKITVIPYGTRFQSGDAPDKPLPPPLRLLFVGAFSERKGMSLMFDAMHNLAERRSPVKLDLVGKPAGNYRLPDRLPLNVRLHLSPPHHEVRRLMQAAHYLLLPSMLEGYGRVLLEALSQGTGIIATNTSGAPDILQETLHAPITIIDSRQPKSLEIAIARLVDRPPDLGCLSRQAVSAARGFTLERYAERVSELVRRELATP